MDLTPPSPPPPPLSLPNSDKEIRGVTGAYDHFIKVPHKRTSLELGGKLSKLLHHLSVEGEKTTAGARSSKMLVLEVTRWEMTGNSFSLFQQQKKLAASALVFENLQLLLSFHISISLFRQHLKACLSVFKHFLSLEEHTELSSAGFSPSSFFFF